MTNGIGTAYAQAAVQAASTAKPKETGKTNKTNGQKEVGNPKLSEKAQKYYDQLKKKFSICVYNIPGCSISSIDIILF